MIYRVATLTRLSFDPSLKTAPERLDMSAIRITAITDSRHQDQHFGHNTHHKHEETKTSALPLLFSWVPSISYTAPTT